MNGLPAGTALANAIFEAYDYKTGNLVDRFVSGVDGRAASKPLPLGRYIIKEVQAPKYFKLSKADTGGKHMGSWIVSNSTTLCKTFKKEQPLPRTGY